MSFILKIIDPKREFYNGDIDFVEFNTTEGYMGIYPKHEPMTMVLEPGILRITAKGEVKEAALHSGFVEILGDRITILAEAVEWPEEIDKNRAEEARIVAERKIQDSAKDGSGAELALKRSLIRIQMANKNK